MTAVNLMNLGLIRNLLAFDFVHVYTLPFVSKSIKVGMVDRRPPVIRQKREFLFCSYPKEIILTYVILRWIEMPLQIRLRNCICSRRRKKAALYSEQCSSISKAA